jgi:hypothetical protein
MKAFKKVFTRERVLKAILIVSAVILVASSLVPLFLSR